jgi:hypothetical protein
VAGWPHSPSDDEGSSSAAPLAIELRGAALRYRSDLPLVLQVGCVIVSRWPQFTSEC